LFIAGRLPLDRAHNLPFEHVAIAAESKQIQQEDDLLTLRVYGIPESIDPKFRNPLEGLQQNTGEYWLEWLNGRIGSDSTAWNLAGRAGNVTDRQAEHFANVLSVMEGSLRFRRGAQFTVDATLTANIRTNCLGFVCSFFEYFGLHLLEHKCPAYMCEYDYAPGQRTFPSPGHLAHALNIRSKRSYKPKTSKEAQKYCRADQTLSEA
jgi:hypothetical protein